MVDEELDPIQIPDEMPVIPLRQLVVFPYMALPLFLGRERSIEAMEDALSNERCVLLVSQRDADVEDPEAGRSLPGGHGRHDHAIDAHARRPHEDPDPGPGPR